MNPDTLHALNDGISALEAFRKATDSYERIDRDAPTPIMDEAIQRVWTARGHAIQNLTTVFDRLGNLTLNTVDPEIAEMFFDTRNVLLDLRAGVDADEQLKDLSDLMYRVHELSKPKPAHSPSEL